MKTRVAIWAAVSSKPQAADDKTSLQDQEDLGRQYAEKIGGEVVRIYKVPGHTRDIVFWHEAEAEMAAYRELRQDIEAQNFDTLWVLDPDRLGRDPALSNQVVSLVEKAGAQLHLSSGDYSIGEDSSAHRYLFAIQAVRAGEDQKKRRQYHEFGMRARIKRGLPSSIWPHGYQAIRNDAGKTISGEFDPGEIEAVKLATRLFLEGKGYNLIAKALNASPWRPRRAKHWSFIVVRKMMQNDTYAGFVTFGNLRSSEPSNKFPALWDQETHRAIIRERQRRYRGGSGPASPVSSIVFCNRCGWAMTSFERNGARQFRCNRHDTYRSTQPCHHNSIREDAIIEALQKVIEIKLQRPGGLEAALEKIGPGRATVEQEIAAIQAQITAIETKQDRLADLAADGIIGRDAARRRTAALAEQLTAADKALADAKERLTTLPDPAEMRARFEQIVRHVDLRSRPLEEVRADLIRAGVRVYVEEHEIVKITLGELH